MSVYKNLSKVRYVLAIAAGKGGVGKSSLCVGLGLALQAAGYSVGLWDADIYGPSLARMLPQEQPPKIDGEGGLFPAQSHGMKVFSLGYGKKGEEATVVRAPIVNGLLIECLRDVVWGELDYLLIDYPPGTGDIQLTIMQEIALSGVILVTTPQNISFIDVRKTIQMCHQMETPILGIVENMSYFVDPHSGQKHKIFGEGAGMQLSETYGFPLLGEMPLDPNFCKCADEGEDVLTVYPDSLASKNLHEIALSVRDLLFVRESTEKALLKSFTFIWKEMD